MQFVETAEQSKLKFIAKPLQYQYHIAGSIIFKKSNYPDLFNEENNKYYQDYNDEIDNNDLAKCRGVKDFFEIEGINGKVSSLYSNYLIFVPCKNFNDLINIWESARIQTIKRYGSFLKISKDF